RRSQREQSNAQKILGLAHSQLIDLRIISGALNTAVPAPVVIRAVPIMLAVCFVVLLVVGDQIVEREAIMASHEVDALFRLALFVSIDLRTPEQPVGYALHHSLLATKEIAKVIAKFSVPLLPAITDETSDLIKTSGIPRLSNQLRAR